MAKNKEAIILIVDCGPSTALQVNEIGNNKTFLEQSIACIKQVLQRKIFSESKDEVALVALGSDSTDNPLAEDGNYNNISIVRKLLPVTWEFIELLDKELTPSTKRGDFIDALVVAFDHLREQTQKWKTDGEKCIYLFSPLVDPFCEDQVVTLLKALIGNAVTVNIIGPVNNENDESESMMNCKAKELANTLANDTQGLWFSFNETMACISKILPRKLKPMAWKTNLKIGKLEIPIAAYLKVKKHHLKSWKKCFKKNETSKLMNEKSYHKYDEAQTQCVMDDIVERYKYGNSLVIYTAEDKANMEYKNSGKCLDVLGFTSLENVKRHQFLGEGVHYVVADEKHAQFEKIGTALSSFVHALYELEMAAIVRKVYSIRSSPIIGALVPRIKADYECLVFVQLPFMEDLRLYHFAPLNTADVTEDEIQLVDDLIDALSPNIKEDKTGLLKRVDNPYIQRLFQCVSHRILNPEEPLLEPDAEKLKLFHPTPKQVDKCSKTTLKMQKVFSLEKVSQSTKRTGESVFLQNTEDDIEVKAKLAKVEASTETGFMNFTKAQPTSVGIVDPVADFLLLLKNPSQLENVVKQMQKVIVQLVTDPVSGLFRQEIFDKIVKCIQELRKALLHNHSLMFNDFLVELKELILKYQKQQLLDMLCKEKLGLITKEESPQSNQTKEANEEFFVIQKAQENEENLVEDDLDDLVGEM